jgi:SAM-dependent methyltransferase
MTIFNALYRGIPIKSDSRVHEAVFDVLKQELSKIPNEVLMLDVATGRGALAQKIIDSFPNVKIDCNDLEQDVLAKGIRNLNSLDLNLECNFLFQYDIILAVEIIEHLENPFHFMRMMQLHLKPNGIIILTTPNVDSFFDRFWFFFKGYPFYFGQTGIINSGGHITMCPVWLLEHIAKKQKLEFSLVSDSVDTNGLLGLKGKLIMKLLSPLRFFIKNYNNRSGTVCVFRSLN